MKIIIVLISFLFILTRPISYPPICNTDTAKQALPPRLFAETTIDPNDQNTYLTRFLHNKYGILLSEFSRCYFSYFDLNYINDILGPIGLLSYLYFLYKTLASKRIVLILFVAALPLVAFFKGQQIILVLLDKIFACIGIATFFFFSRSKTPEIE